VEDDGGDGAAAVLQLLDGLHAGGVLGDVHPVEADALLGEKSFGPLAVRAPRCAVDGDAGHQGARSSAARTPTSVPGNRCTIMPRESMTITVGGAMTSYSALSCSSGSATLGNGTRYVVWNAAPAALSSRTS